MSEDSHFTVSLLSIIISIKITRKYEKSLIRFADSHFLQ